MKAENAPIASAIKPNTAGGKTHVKWTTRQTLCDTRIAPNWKMPWWGEENVEITCKRCLSYIGFALPKMWWES